MTLNIYIIPLDYNLTEEAMFSFSLFNCSNFNFYCIAYKLSLANQTVL